MSIEEKKSKIVFCTTDKLWDKLRATHRTTYPEDKTMNDALTRAVEEFTK
jgi:hypothetical protein